MIGARAIVLLGILNSALFTVGATAQQRPSGRLLGVFDDATGKPLEGVDVVVLTTNATATTSNSGAVSLALLDSGTTLLQLRKVGYASRIVPVITSSADTTPITLVLKPLSQTLPAVVTRAASVTPKFADFERRRASGGGGHFITQDVLDKNPQLLTAEIMMRIPGLVIVGTPQSGIVGNTRGQQSLMGTRTFKGFCLAAVIVDGAMVYSGAQGDAPFSVNSYRPDEIAGIEYYAGGASMPAEYNATRTTCGLVVIWTR